MDKRQEARFERYDAIIMAGLKRASIHGLLIGVVFGPLAGIGFGVMVGARFFG